MIHALKLLTLSFCMLLCCTTFAHAQFRTNSNTVNTLVGNPPTSNSPLAQVAISLVETVGTACGGFLRGSNLNCVQGISLPDVPSASLAINQLTSSASTYECGQIAAGNTCLQCVGFVQAAVGGSTGEILNNGGNAKDYATNVPTGYQYYTVSSNTPLQEGDIIIKTGGQWGHIGIVTLVYDQSTIQVAEANFGFGGELGLKNSSPDVWNGFLRKI